MKQHRGLGSELLGITLLILGVFINGLALLVQLSSSSKALWGVPGFLLVAAGGYFIWSGIRASSKDEEDSEN